MRDTIQGLGWFVRRSANVPRLSAFYRDVVGLTPLRSSPTVTMFWAGDISVIEVNIGGTPPPEYQSPSDAPLVPVFRCHGIAGTIDRLKKAGVTFLAEHGQEAYFLDLDGQVTGLQERPAGSPLEADVEADRRWKAGETRLSGVDPLAPDLQSLGRIVLRGADVEKLVDFFQNIIGLDLAAEPFLTTALFKLGETALLQIGEGGYEQEAPEDRQTVGNTFIIRVHDLEGIVADLKRKGVRFVNEPFDIVQGRLAYFLTPENHTIGLQQRSATTIRIEDWEANRRWAAQQAARA